MLISNQKVKEIPGCTAEVTWNWDADDKKEDGKKNKNYKKNFRIKENVFLTL